MRSTQIDTQSELLQYSATSLCSAEYTACMCVCVTHTLCVCLYVCVYVSVCVFMCVYVFVHIRLYVCMCTFQLRAELREQCLVFGVSAAATDRVETNIGTLMSL